MGSEVEGNWDIVITSLQDIATANESTTFDSIYSHHTPESLQALATSELNQLQTDIVDHKANVATAKRLITTSCENLTRLIEHLQAEEQRKEKEKKKAEALEHEISSSSVSSPNKRSATNKAAGGVKKANKAGGKGKKIKKVGRSFWQSKYNPSEPIFVGSEVAFKLRGRTNEWIQCQVMKILGDGIKFELQDPEPDENNNIHPTFRATYKEILLIPPGDDAKELPNYAYGTKVLAQYPETTTYYAAIVVGTKKDGIVRLKFDGEEEVNKETEVKRRLVLPLPQK
ncbi:uncharacterized protein LODBEIA_P58510 [Lodderomyces beijingensis]|uniref:SGF29 C-terminal domain-containing protein n=1 Tax=Lodderomyces beijingensis TaxID=1775926 RepID=A0ABP0ZWP4_9ASCO